MASQDMLDLEGLLGAATNSRSVRLGEEGDLSALLEEATGEGEGISSAVVPRPQPATVPMIDMSKHPSGIIPTLQNIVATVNLECRLDLKTIALHARNAEYNPKVNCHRAGLVRLYLFFSDLPPSL